MVNDDLSWPAQIDRIRAEYADTIAAMQEQLDDQAAHDGELIAVLTAERDEALNQLNSARHSVDVLERRVESLLAERDDQKIARLEAVRSWVNAEARVKELEGASHGLLNWCDVLLTTVQETSCDPEDPDAFDQAIMGVQMFASQCRAAFKTKGADNG